MAVHRWPTPRFWELEHRVDEILKRRYAHPGGPKKGEEPKLPRHYQLVVTVKGPKSAVIAEERLRRSAYVLISNDTTRTAGELLREDTEQSSVEQGFRFFKQPRHLSPLFLQRPDRIEAFGYVLALALLIYTLIQKKMRDALATPRRPLMVSWRGEMRRPTTHLALDIMERIQTVTARLGDCQFLIYTRPSNEQRYILELLDTPFPVHSVACVTTGIRRNVRADS